MDQSQYLAIWLERVGWIKPRWNKYRKSAYVFVASLTSCLNRGDLFYHRFVSDISNTTHVTVSDDTTFMTNNREWFSDRQFAIEHGLYDNPLTPYRYMLGRGLVPNDNHDPFNGDNVRMFIDYIARIFEQQRVKYVFHALDYSIYQHGPVEISLQYVNDFRNIYEGLAEALFSFFRVTGPPSHIPRPIPMTIRDIDNTYTNPEIPWAIMATLKQFLNVLAFNENGYIVIDANSIYGDLNKNFLSKYLFTNAGVDQFKWWHSHIDFSLQFANTIGLEISRGPRDALLTQQDARRWDSLRLLTYDPTGKYLYSSGIAKDPMLHLRVERSKTIYMDDDMDTWKRHIANYNDLVATRLVEQVISLEHGMHIPVIRHAYRVDAGKYYGQHPADPQSFCGTFYYGEPESTTMIYSGPNLIVTTHKAAVADFLMTVAERTGDPDIIDLKNSVDEVLQSLRSTPGFDERYAFLIANDGVQTPYQLLQNDPYNMLFENAPIEGEWSPTRDDQGDPIYLGKLFGLYSSEDGLDQPVCRLASALGYSAILLTRMVGSFRMTQEFWDVRPREESLRNLIFLEKKRQRPTVKGAQEEEEEPVQKQPLCLLCSNVAKYLCSYCINNVYCSEECQRRDWIINNHGQMCNHH